MGSLGLIESGYRSAADTILHEEFCGRAARMLGRMQATMLHALRRHGVEIEQDAIRLVRKRR